MTSIHTSETTRIAAQGLVPPPPRTYTPSPAHVGMLAFLLSEAAFFSTLILTYVVYIGKSETGPYPRDVLSLPLVFLTTACLLSSSGTVHLAERALFRGARGVFLGWWTATIALGILFLLGTAYEWYGLLTHDPPLTISRNLFGTTYYTLVGFHAAHVTVGVVVMSIM